MLVHRAIRHHNVITSRPGPFVVSGKPASRYISKSSDARPSRSRPSSPKGPPPAPRSSQRIPRQAAVAASPTTPPSGPPALSPSESRPSLTSPSSPAGVTPVLTDPSSTRSAFDRSRAIPWVLASILAGGIAFYGGALYVSATQPCLNPGISSLTNQKDVSARYDATADSFDSEVGLSEWLMGMNSTRKSLARRCKGHVLEVSCGTGRNLGYFDVLAGDRVEGEEVESLTFVDLSKPMVDVCRRKWDVLFSSKRSKLRPGLVIRFLPADALGALPPPPQEEQKGYDTILQTMGLCSTASPVALLTNLAKYLDPSNPSARIYLLEHGRSYTDWLNRILDNSAEKHAELHGCWFNRDIGQIVADAAEQAGLEIVRERRRHVGTTWVFELRRDPAKAIVGSTSKGVKSGGHGESTDEGLVSKMWKWIGWGEG